jgi:hypothetical protein
MLFGITDKNYYDVGLSRFQESEKKYVEVFVTDSN